MDRGKAVLHSPSARDKTMRRAGMPWLVLAVVTLVTTGCGSNNKGKIEGTKWISIASTVKGTSVPAGTLKLEFGSDGTLVYNAGPQTFRGTYSLGSGNTITLKLDRELAGSKTHVQKVVIEDDRLTM